MGKFIKWMVSLAAALTLATATACVAAPGEMTPSPPLTSESPSAVAPTTSPPAENNFRLLISDEKNAIGDFTSLNITIESIGVHKGGETGNCRKPPFKGRIEPNVSEFLKLIKL